jgi:hypothetical protein
MAPNRPVAMSAIRSLLGVSGLIADMLRPPFLTQLGSGVCIAAITGAGSHKTIADFRKDNGTAIRKVCVRFVYGARSQSSATLRAEPAAEQDRLEGDSAACGW